MINISDYIDLKKEYSYYKEQGYYINPGIISIIIDKELNIPITYKEIEKFIKGSNVKLTPFETNNQELLNYYKNYINILKKKIMTLLSVQEDLCNNYIYNNLSQDSLKRLVELDFHLNSIGNIYYKDAIRLAEAIIYNITDLYNTLLEANNINSYKNKNIKENYPDERIITKNLSIHKREEFIELTEKQIKEIRRDNTRKLIRQI